MQELKPNDSTLNLVTVFFNFKMTHNNSTYPNLE